MKKTVPSEVEIYCIKFHILYNIICYSIHQTPIVCVVMYIAVYSSITKYIGTYIFSVFLTLQITYVFKKNVIIIPKKLLICLLKSVKN